jgi:hypothetical protein
MSASFFNKPATIYPRRAARKEQGTISLDEISILSGFFLSGAPTFARLKSSALM